MPSHEYDKMVNFHGVVLGLKQKEANSPDSFESVTFEYGDKTLWLDNISGINQAEVRLEIETDNAVEAKKYLEP